MKKILKYILLVSLILTCCVQCAKRGTPTGGPEDITPPRFLRASPENYSTNFDASEIRIYFDEYIRLQEAQRQIIISPPMDPRPEITPLGTASRYLRIRINDTLQENTTYVINFGRSIVDNNAENSLPFFKYVFSTGSYIDSLSLSGQITDAFEPTPETFVSVMLYEIDSTYTDSSIYKNSPTYLTNTLDSTGFQLSSLKAGTYKLVAVKDNNNNYRYDPKSEKIGFAEDYIQIPTDSTYILRLFQSIPQFNVTRPSMTAGQHVIFGYEGILELNSLDISLLNAPQNFEQRIIKDQETDTLHYFYKPALERDSVTFAITTQERIDTISIRKANMPRDSLQTTVLPKGNIAFNDSLRLTANTPIEIEDPSQFSIMNRDSIQVNFTARLHDVSNEIIFDFEKEENQTYLFTASPGAIRDFYDSTNDSISIRLRTKEHSDFGNLFVTVENSPEHPIILQIITEKGEIRGEKYGTGQNYFEFENIQPAKYRLRVIIDENRNQRWDPGDFLKQIQPERSILYPELLDVRANWDVSQTFRL